MQGGDLMDMEEVGYIGTVDDRAMFLFQCPRCKTVKIQKWIDGTPRCPICKGIK